MEKQVLIVLTLKIQNREKDVYKRQNKNLNIEQPVIVTQVTNSGKFNSEFYSSKKDNIIKKKKSENVSEHDIIALF